MRATRDGRAIQDAVTDRNQPEQGAAQNGDLRRTRCRPLGPTGFVRRFDRRIDHGQGQRQQQQMQAGEQQEEALQAIILDDAHPNDGQDGHE